MAADKIIQQIKADAQAAADQISAEALEKAASLGEKIIQEANARVLQIEASAKADADEELRRAQLIAELEGRKSELSSKRAVLDEAYEEAAKELSALSGEKWEKLIISIVLSCSETGAELLRVPSKDREKYQAGMIDKLNDALKAAGKKGCLTLDEKPASFADGIALVSKTSEIDGSFSAVLSDMRRQTEKDVAALLFSEVK